MDRSAISETPRTAHWEGASGTQYPFQVDLVGAPFRPIAAVYVVCTPAPNDLWHAVYIGTSDNLQRDLGTDFVNHPELQCMHKAGSTHICTLALQDVSQHRDIASDLIAKLDPPCNRPLPS